MNKILRYSRQSLWAPLIFLLKLLILHFLFKTLFLWLNPFDYSGPSWSWTQWLYWSVSGDALVLLAINVPWILLLALFSLAGMTKLQALVKWPFLLVNLVALLLNLADVFYFRFQRQRANADLLYVARYPFHRTVVHHPWITLLALLAACMLCWLLLIWYRQWQHGAGSPRQASFAAVVFGALLALFLFVSPGRQLPTYPLTSVSASLLPYVQNSFQCFVYSVYRSKDATVHQVHYMDDGVARQLVPGLARNPTPVSPGPRKNVVLFIMESVPYDFFDSTGTSRLRMPFLDSLREHSLFFDRAYAYSHHSNKGIVAILAGMPTLTEIPLYHSGYTSMPVTHAGGRLSDLGYRSLFFIGDDHDDFGFAKCVNWLGISQYFSKENIPGYRDLESHTMGLHDEYVLNFMQGVLHKEQQPFFATHYNTSTHYPNDLPKAWQERLSKTAFSPQMKSMLYYDDCLSDFFSKASASAWFRNTVFIFCSDHWMYPDARDPVSNETGSFRIPIMIYDPTNQEAGRDGAPVSQLDIMNTVLHIAGDTGSFVSFGRSLLLPDSSDRMIVSRENASLYQVFSKTHVLGFNPVTGKTEFCYLIGDRKENRVNLADSGGPVVRKMENYLKAYLQRASGMYLEGIGN